MRFRVRLQQTAFVLELRCVVGSLGSSATSEREQKAPHAKVPRGLTNKNEEATRSGIDHNVRKKNTRTHQNKRTEFRTQQHAAHATELAVAFIQFPDAANVDSGDATILSWPSLLHQSLH